jgi:hypothetical protein
VQFGKNTEPQQDEIYNSGYCLPKQVSITTTFIQHNRDTSRTSSMLSKEKETCTIGILTICQVEALQGTFGKSEISYKKTNSTP